MRTDYGKRCTMCWGMTTGLNIMCEECLGMFPHEGKTKSNAVNSSYWWEWGKEKTRGRRAANILKYGDIEW